MMNENENQTEVQTDLPQVMNLAKCMLSSFLPLFLQSLHIVTRYLVTQCVLMFFHFESHAGLQGLNFSLSPSVPE